MSARLTAYVNGRRAGWFEQRDGTVRFTFDDDWRSASRRLELSLSLPTSKSEHAGTAPENFLWNLLPDNTGVLERWGRQFGANPRNAMALLEHVGLDAPGAIQLAVSDEPALNLPAHFEPLSDADIAQRIRDLHRDPQAWLSASTHTGYFSLAGAQPKFTLAHTPRGWALPSGSGASTHIVKPGIAGLADSDVAEHLTMRAAVLLGLEVAGSAVMAFEDQRSIVVERFDRTPDGSVRLHQEDLAQATGIHPRVKYQAEGGPGLAALAALIREARGREADASVNRLVDAAIFAWVALATDMHCKNFALLHDAARGPRLAPLYDVATFAPFAAAKDRKVKLSMAYDSRYRAFEIERRHVLRLATVCGVDADWARSRIETQIARCADAFSTAAREMREVGAGSTALSGAAAAHQDAFLNAAFLDRTVDTIAARIARL